MGIEEEGKIEGGGLGGGGVKMQIGARRDKILKTALWS